MNEAFAQHLWELKHETPDCPCHTDRECTCLPEPCDCGATTADTCTCP